MIKFQVEGYLFEFFLLLRNDAVSLGNWFTFSVLRYCNSLIYEYQHIQKECWKQVNIWICMDNAANGWLVKLQGQSESTERGKMYICVVGTWKLLNWLESFSQSSKLPDYLKCFITDDETEDQATVEFSWLRSKRKINIQYIFYLEFIPVYRIYYLESRSRGISYVKYVNGRWTGLITFYVETAFFNGLLKERYKGG